ncbi:very short patch repair endonuclease [Bacillus sp. DTU_2020_1000418_1_SI_GHA_SEK_038]|uniref:very short patch repair endonuclease n=1 Tax=Bacillus sp. DTU_2020_1000418_1_SI_GHA_SEK_038 TaxID=3077585 RepID=UPI0028E5CBBC|nr:very short patch repair endonuclease [Bacillus sp. DTU_2020_1000418_1_SI_GHA_SEK_038]WNS73685.1 very short patch repair endonuclease [Bacillus sp. DTU_2020_1000418_1_SI_GHA_SEK_038]
MPDKITKEQRSKNMQAIKSQSNLENNVSKALWKKGFRFRKNTKMFGKPDISIKKYKVVIFIDSCFWHCCPVHGNMPKSNQDYWKNKLGRNKSRDKEVTSFYIENGWKVLRIWEHEFKQDFEKTIEMIADFIRSAKNSK